MKMWIKLAVRLYPKTWPARYGVEIEALIDDVPPRWTDLSDPSRGALMQLRSGQNY